MEEQKIEEQKVEEQKPEKKGPEEAELLLDKTIHCPVCDNVFKSKAVKNGKVRRLEPEGDLRPRFQYIDTLKYEVDSCPYCGYSAMRRYFDHLAPIQRKMVKENISVNFMKNGNNGNTVKPLPATYTYAEAVARYKLALYNTEVKRGAVSEKAYTCLKISWLYRGKCEEALAKGETEDSESVKKDRQEERRFYEEAYVNMEKAVETERPPICGMDENTMDFLLAGMSYRLEKYDRASRYVSRVLSSNGANRHMKDKALDLKQEIVAAIREQKEEE